MAAAETPLLKGASHAPATEAMQKPLTEALAKPGPEDLIPLRAEAAEISAREKDPIHQQGLLLSSDALIFKVYFIENHSQNK